MKKFKAVIVDDENLAIQDISDVLEEIDEITVVGAAKDIDNAEKLIAEKKPDIVFLDIQLKGENGFDLLEKIESGIKIIFVTAFDSYAIKAFEVNAMDYLLKPVNPERVKKTLEKMTSENRFEKHEPELDYDDSMFLLLNSKYQFVKISDIIAVTASGDYTRLTMKDGTKKLSQKSMREWEQRFPSRQFCRIHRATIINLTFVEKVEEWFNQSYSVHLRGIEKPVAMSRGYANKLKKILG